MIAWQRDKLANGAWDAESLPGQQLTSVVLGRVGTYGDMHLLAEYRRSPVQIACKVVTEVLHDLRTYPAL